MERTFAEIQKQTKAVQDSAKAAFDANRLTEESIRGRIAFKSFALDRPLRLGGKSVFVAQIENVGHSSAIIRSKAESHRWKTLPPGDMPITISPETSDLEPGGTSTFVIEDKQPISQSFLNQIDAGQLKPFFFGRILYETIGREHHTDFCAFVMPQSTINLPKTTDTLGVVIDFKYALRQCDKWHDSN